MIMKNLNVIDLMCVAVFVLRELDIIKFPLWIIIVYIVCRFIELGTDKLFNQ